MNIKNIANNLIIALNNGTSNIEKGPADFNQAGQLLYAIVSLFFIIVLIYIAAMFLKNKNLTFVKSKNIEVIEKISIGVGNVIAILRCGENYFLVSITKEKTTLITKLEKDDLDFSNDSKNTMDFSNVLSNFIKNDKKTREDITDDKNE